jgi:hypothetical protein
VTTYMGGRFRAEMGLRAEFLNNVPKA